MQIRGEEMTDQTTQLLGESIGGLKIIREIAASRFSRIFEASSGDEIRALKVSRNSDDLGEKNWHSTAAIGRAIGMCGEGPPHPDEVVKLEYERLTNLQVPNSAIVNVGASFSESDLCAYDMEYLSCKSLRSIISTPESKPVLLNLARTLQELATTHEISGWGNLKPEHVLICDSSQIRLVSPGVFSKKFWIGKIRLPGAITSPAYYPTLEPNDLFAFGLMLWESFMGSHPLQHKAISREQLDKTYVGDSFLRMIESYEGTANHFPAALLEIKPPSQMGMPERIEKLLLKGLGLEKSAAGKIEEGPSFDNFLQIADELEGVLKNG